MKPIAEDENNFADHGGIEILLLEEEEMFARGRAKVGWIANGH